MKKMDSFDDFLPVMVTPTTKKTTDNRNMVLPMVSRRFHCRCTYVPGFPGSLHLFVNTILDDDRRFFLPGYVINELYNRITGSSVINI